MRRAPAQRRAGFAYVLGVALLAACTDLEPIRDCADQGDVRVHCGFQNPEDLAAAPGGEWIVVSQFPRLVDGEFSGTGSLLALRPRDGERRALYPSAEAGRESVVPGVGSPDCGGPPDAARFSPHGIEVGAASGDEARLLVVNHGGREAVELFRLRVAPEGPALAWEGCVPLPDDAQGNDVAALPDGGFVVTKMLPRETGPLTILRLMLGLPTGELLTWDLAAGWRPVPDTRASAPNGVVASPDGATLYFAAWGGSRLVRVGRDGSGRRELAVPHHPDNLSWASDGRLLSTGQQGSLLIVPACQRIASGTCPIPYSVVRVAPDFSSSELVFAEDPPRLSGAGTVALAHDDALWIGTFAGDRILRVPVAQ
jgi:sugar lactone lactonase YvrE